MKPIYLGVNIDHVATLRQVRGAIYPDPVHAAALAEMAGADGITVHLREDRRHITDRDVELLRHTLKTRMNLEMAATDEMVAIARRIQPEFVCLVPERRAELTTEGGLDVVANRERLTDVVGQLAEAGIKVSLVIDADLAQIDAARAVGARHGHGIGLNVNAGHGLHYHNVAPIAALTELEELNIGHAIVARAVLTGLPEAVREMKRLMVEARRYGS